MKKCFLCGYVGQDPQLRVSKTGKSFMSFTLGVRENKESSMWINIYINSEKIIDNLMPYVKKGSHLNIFGILGHPAHYATKDNKINTTNVVHAVEIQLLDRKSANNSNNDVYTLPDVNNLSNTENTLLNDIPF